MKVYAHRGSNRIALENSWSAFRQAIDEGVDGIELDLQVTADGHFVVMHDSSLQRTTGIKAKVSDLTRREIENLRLLNGESIPFFDEVMKKLLPLVEINAELKFKGKSAALKFAQDISKNRYWMKITVSSSYVDPIAAIAKAFPQIRRALVVDSSHRSNPERTIQDMKKGRCSAIHVASSLVNRKFVAEANLRGWNVTTWFSMKGETLNHATAWQRLVDAQVACVITNVPADFYAWYFDTKSKRKVS